MKKLMTSFLLAAACFTVGGFVGCSETSTSSETQKVTTPGGTTTKETKVEVKKTGDNPPETPK